MDEGVHRGRAWRWHGQFSFFTFKPRMREPDEIISRYVLLWTSDCSLFLFPCQDSPFPQSYNQEIPCVSREALMTTMEIISKFARRRVLKCPIILKCRPILGICLSGMAGRLPPIPKQRHTMMLQKMFCERYSGKDRSLVSTVWSM
jgi:hypothetical protein